MSVSGAMLSAFRGSLKTRMLTETCTRATAASDWVATSSVLCLVEEAGPQAAAALDYESGNGYGYAVYLPHNATMETTDRITCGAGTLEVVRVTPIGTLDGVRRADCIKR